MSRGKRRAPDRCRVGEAVLEKKIVRRKVVYLASGFEAPLCPAAPARCGTTHIFIATELLRERHVLPFNEEWMRKFIKQGRLRRTLLPDYSILLELFISMEQ